MQEHSIAVFVLDRIRVKRGRERKKGEKVPPNTLQFNLDW